MAQVVTLQDLQNRSDGDLAHQLRMLKEAAEQQVMEDRALARKVAEHLLPAQVNDLAKRDPRALNRMTTREFLLLIQQAFALSQMVFDIADTAHGDPASLIRALIEDRAQLQSELERARQQSEEAQTLLANQRAAPGQASRRSAAAAPNGAAATTAYTLPLLPESPKSEDTALEHPLTRISDGEHRETVPQTDQHSLLEQALSQGLLTRLKVDKPTPTGLIDLAPEGLAWLSARGIAAPANPQLSILQSRGLSLNAIFAVLWAIASLDDLDVSPPFIGDVQPAFTFQRRPVFVADTSTPLNARQLGAVLNATGGTLWLLAVDQASQNAVKSQAALACDDYKKLVRQPATICLTNTSKLTSGARHTDGSIWIYQSAP